MRFVILLCALSACSGDDSDVDLGVVDQGVVDASAAIVPADLVSATDAAAVPIVAPTNEWTWVDVEDAVCSDGSQTGIGVNPGTDPSKLYIYFEGGGACGDYSSCYKLMTATLGAFGKPELDAAVPHFGTLLQRGVDSPFADWTLVYIPYCTADLHGGIRTVEYTGNGDTKTLHHMGHINALRDLDRLVATWPNLSELVVSGSSAGGYGALINYGDARQRWPSPKSYLIDDSGPPLESAFSGPLLTLWYGSWGLIDWARGLCPECASDVSSLIPNIAKRYPNDRMSLLESLEDAVISAFYLLPGPDFAAALQQLAADRIVPLPNFRSFYINGSTHTMLSDPAAFSSGGTTLSTFLTQQLDDDAAWKSISP